MVRKEEKKHPVIGSFPHPKSPHFTKTLCAEKHLRTHFTMSADVDQLYQKKFTLGI